MLFWREPHCRAGSFFRTSFFVIAFAYRRAALIRAALSPATSRISKGRSARHRAALIYLTCFSGGCKSLSLELGSVVVVKGWTEFIEADYETRSDCHRVACDG